MSDPTPDAVDPKVAQDRQLLADAQAKGTGATLAAYFKLSGPGWLQSAITLGGGSLAGSLYLGVIAGYQFNWLQPLMMILGIVMLAAIAYVTLSTGERPFGAINKHINPVLGWGWLIAAMMANLVWAMPQFSLGTSALEQNLMPAVFGGDAGKYIAVGLLFAVSFVIVIFYDTGAVKLFELVLKIMVGVVVLSFFGVVVMMAVKGRLDWGGIFAGFIPDLSLLYEPADVLARQIDASSNPDYWRAVVVNSQQDRMITAAATAVGINMTFLLPYSMLRKGWGPTFRGLATFDLSTGLFIPFVLATGCVIIAAAAQFHGDYDKGLLGEQPRTILSVEMEGGYLKTLDTFLDKQGQITPALRDAQKDHAGRVKAQEKQLAADHSKAAVKQLKIADPYLGVGPAPLDPLRNAAPEVDRKLAAMLVERDAFVLAGSLENLTGDKIVSQYVFGIGVLGMAVSTIIILMLINGFCLTEMCGVQARSPLHLLGCLLPGITGAAGFLFLWGDDQARFWLAVPTSRIGMILLPVAYITFFLMMNNRAMLGQHMLRGGKRLIVNALMLVAIAVSVVGSAMAIWNTRMKIPGTDLEARWPILGLVVAFILLALIVQLARAARPKPAI